MASHALIRAGLCALLENGAELTWRKLQLLLVVFLLTALAYGTAKPAPTEGTTYYVSLAGSDSNPGTLSDPFRTVHKGVSVLKPGDTVYIRRGTYAESLQNKIPGGTSWAAPVTVAAYPGEAVALKPPTGSSRVLYFSSAAGRYIIIDGMSLDAINVTTDALKITKGSTTGSSHHIRIKNCEIKNAPGQGILVSGSSNYNEFINLRVHDNGRRDLDHGFYIETNYNLIKGCTVYRNAGAGIHVFKERGVNGMDAGYNVICNNKSHENARVGRRGVGIGIYTGAGNKAYNNLIWGNVDGIWVDYNASDTLVANNTIYGTTGRINDHAGIYIGSGNKRDVGALRSVVRNNIIYRCASTIVDKGTKTRADHNLLNVDPRFVDAPRQNFHLRADSPAVEAGATVKEVGDDFDGISRPQGKAYDIGAFERRAR